MTMKKHLSLFQSIATIIVACLLFEMQNKAMYSFLLLLFFMINALIVNREKQNIKNIWTVLLVVLYIAFRLTFRYAPHFDSAALLIWRLMMALSLFLLWMLAGYLGGFFLLKWKLIQRNHTMTLLTVCAIILILLSALIDGHGSYFFGSGFVYLMIPYIAHRYVTQNKYAPLVIITPYALLQIIVFYIEDVSVYNYPIIIIPLVSIGVYYLARLFRKPITIIILILYTAFLGYGWYVGIDNYCQWLRMQRSKVSENTMVEFCFYTNDNKPVTQDSLKGKIVVFDFWNTACGVCFQQFPDYDKFYQKYSHRNDIAIYAVYLPWKRDTEESLKAAIDKLTAQYSFPILIADSTDYRERFNIKGVPEVMVLNKQGEVAYKGSLEFSRKVIYNIEDVVEKLLNSDK